MKNFQIKKSSLRGVIESSPSKSHTLRAILFASLASGKSTIRHYLLSPDAYAMIEACRQLGAVINITDELITIEGVAGKIKTPGSELCICMPSLPFNISGNVCDPDELI